VIVADTGAILALVDADERHHQNLRRVFEDGESPWVLPWAILPEIDYLLSTHVGRRAEEAFLSDLADGVYAVEWGSEADLLEARRICKRHRALKLGLVDSVVIAVAERLKAEAIATLDLRHFGALRIRGGPKLFPRDL
jgi:predicted nucleic acid-binding protein